jgi:predicted CopG family antitoxin
MWRHALAKYATISVPDKVKKVLQEAKGHREWGEFLMELYEERSTLRSKRAFEEAASLLTSEDLKSIVTSSKEFREKFTLR